MQESTNPESATIQSTEKKTRRGFASMDPERQRLIASQGGRVAHQLGVAHQWTSEEARNAGKKGGQNSRPGSRNGQP
jgi:general stress protein YciG